MARRSDDRAPAAKRFNGQRRDFILHADGTIEGSTPTEQGVLMSLCIRRGQLAHAQTVGNDLRRVQPSTPEREASEIRAAIERATPLDVLLAEKQVEILSIEHQFSHTGRLSVAVAWRDLSTGARATTTNG
jgi:hypothetical protein